MATRANNGRRRTTGRKNVRKKSGMTVKGKIVLTSAFFALGLIGASLAVIYVAQGKGEGYKKKYLAQQTYSSNPIIAKRGDISDRRGVAFAKSVLVYNFVLEPKIILSKEDDYRAPTVKLVSEYFGISQDELNKMNPQDDKQGDDMTGADTKANKWRNGIVYLLILALVIRLIFYMMVKR